MQNLYRTVFLKSKTAIDKTLARISTVEQKQNYLNITLKNEILKSETEIRASFKKINCANCGACCSLAISEFSPDKLLQKAKNGDKTASSFLETFTPYKVVPKELLPAEIDIKGCYFYHCKKVKFKDGKSFCPIYENRPAVCRNFPDTPLENLPETCAYKSWKNENETKALFIKALNDIRNFYLKHLPE